MIVLLSPTKQMDFTSVITINPEGKKPQFGYEAGMLNGLLRNYDKPGLELLMKISPAPAEQTYENICRIGSDEYAKVIDRKNLNGRFLSIHFKEKDGARLQTVGKSSTKTDWVFIRNKSSVS